MHHIQTLSTLPIVLVYLGVSLVAFAVFTAVYTRLTPHDDFKMIRSGSVAAALGLVSAWIGFGLPLFVLVVRAADLIDFGLWALIAGAVQWVAFLIARAILHGAVIEEGHDTTNMGHAVLVAGINVAAGLINAACLLG